MFGKENLNNDRKNGIILYLNFKKFIIFTWLKFYIKLKSYNLFSKYKFND